MGALADLTGDSPRLHARITGLVGVVMLASGSFAGFVGSRLVVRDDTVTTARNLAASESLFRLGIAASLVMMIAFLGYALLLHRLLRPVSRAHAMLMVALVLAAVPIFMLDQVNQYAALRLATAQLHDQMRLFLDMHRLGSLIAGILFGLWLFPLGLLVYRSRFFPKLLGVLLMAGSPGYVVLFVQGFLFEGSEGGLWSNPFLVVTHLSELAMMLWLLIRGVDADAWERRATEAAGAGRAAPLA